MSAPTATTQAKPAATAAAKTRKPRKPSGAHENETPSQKFRRLGPPRIAKAVTALRRIETIGKSRGYEFTAEQAAKVMKYLDDAIERCRLAFVDRVNDRPEDGITL